MTESVRICDGLTERLREILNDKLSKSIINLDKETLFVITQSTEDESLDEITDKDRRDFGPPGLTVTKVIHK